MMPPIACRGLYSIRFILLWWFADQPTTQTAVAPALGGDARRRHREPAPIRLSQQIGKRRGLDLSKTGLTYLSRSYDSTVV